jgi:carboxymethylenebutenolidase
VMERNFPDWLRTIAEATTYGVERPNADPERVALVGYSLGAYLAVSLSTFDPRVRAVVDYSGGLPDQLADRESSLVPTLILHGEADPIVSVDEARKLERRLQAHGIEHEIRIFPGVGHGFLGEAAREADRLAVEFLARRLKSEP